MTSPPLSVGAFTLWDMRAISPNRVHNVTSSASPLCRSQLPYKRNAELTQSALYIPHFSAVIVPLCPLYGTVNCFRNKLI
jgi:hypothetical protein